ALAGVGAYFSYLKEKQRTEALRQLAEGLQFDFSAKDDAGLLTSLAPDNFHLFAQGSGKKCSNVLRGQANDLEVTIFDYRYTTGSGKSSHTWRQTVIVFRLPGPPLPAFSLRPLNFWHKVGHLFGYQDITFDEHPAFSARYLLRGPNEAAVRQLFTEEALAWYEGTNGLSTEGRGDRLLFYRHNKRVEPPAIRSFLEEGFKVLALFNPPGDETQAQPNAE
ncbi:MAG TPA: hypothetical protein VJ739_13405, partial [Gemmataceae bacterium]|nr:hypothetical protein [Gemmataceae bacterium]